MVAFHKSRSWLFYAILFAAAALLIAACGGSSHAPSVVTSTTSTAAGGAPAADAASGSPGHPHRLGAGRDTVSSGAVTQRPVRGTGGNEINDDNPGRADGGNGTATGQNPCALVSKAEAQAIIGEPIATPQEAPLGPTCIYRPLGTKGLTTIAVESLDIAKIRSQIRNLRRVAVGGRTAYCGDYGRPAIFVPLAHGQVLNVVAPCAVGTRLAGKALSRLEG